MFFSASLFLRPTAYLYVKGNILGHASKTASRVYSLSYTVERLEVRQVKQRPLEGPGCETQAGVRYALPLASVVEAAEF